MRRAHRASRSHALSLIALLWAAPALLHAQFGTVELTKIIPTSAFAPQNSTITFFNEGFTYYQATGGSNIAFLADLDLPPGAKVNTVCAFAKDNDATGEVFLDYSVVELGSSTNPSVTTIVNAGTGVADTKGYYLHCLPTPANTIVRAFGDPDGDTTSQFLAHRVSVGMKASTGLSFGGALVKWQRVQAPAPAVATFADVPTNFLFFRAIENLAASGITGGCSPGNYCPNANITRGEAAAFFSKAMGLSWPQ